MNRIQGNASVSYSAATDGGDAASTTAGLTEQERQLMSDLVAGGVNQQVAFSIAYLSQERALAPATASAALELEKASAHWISEFKAAAMPRAGPRPGQAAFDQLKSQLLTALQSRLDDLNNALQAEPDSKPKRWLLEKSAALARIMGETRSMPLSTAAVQSGVAALSKATADLVPPSTRNRMAVDSFKAQVSDRLDRVDQLKARRDALDPSQRPDRDVLTGAAMSQFMLIQRDLDSFSQQMDKAGGEAQLLRNLKNLGDDVGSVSQGQFEGTDWPDTKRELAEEIAKLY